MDRSKVEGTWHERVFSHRFAPMDSMVDGKGNLATKEGEVRSMQNLVTDEMVLKFRDGYIDEDESTITGEINGIKSIGDRLVFGSKDSLIFGKV